MGQRERKKEELQLLHGVGVKWGEYKQNFEALQRFRVNWMQTEGRIFKYN
jgi:hypothetical protein